MPRLRYTEGSRYALRDGPTWEDGDVYEVDDATADRLVELDKFEFVDGTAPALDDAIDRGVCPWCDEYEGEHVGQHASLAHSDEWNAYTEAR